MMKQCFLLILFFIFLQPLVIGQQATRKLQSTPVVNHQNIFEGRYFTLTLINSDTAPVLLKLGPIKQIKNGDTLKLARTYPCGNPTTGEYYDLHDLVDEEDNCVRWYTLQPIKSKDTLRFVIKLKDFDKSDTSRLYYCYTKEVQKVDKELKMYDDPKKIYIMKDNRDFETDFIAINKNAINTSFAKVGLNIYISDTNQQ